MTALRVVASADSPPAPYPPDTRAKGWRFELDMERVRQSDTWALASREMRPWLLMLWVTAWEQRPCGSLPADDELIAARMEMDIRQFRAHRDILLRGWVLHADGRLYHPTITERVLQMSSKRGDDAARVATRRRLAAETHAIDGGCVYCGSTEDLTLDRMLPLRLGGTDDPDNLASACRGCSSAKRNRTPEAAKLTFVNKGAADRWRRYKENQQLSENVAATRSESRSVAASPTPEPIKYISEKTSSSPHPVSRSRSTGAAGFAAFWDAWPAGERKQDKRKCAALWKRRALDAQLDAILSDIAVKRRTQKWRSGYIEAPLVYLRGERWADGVTPCGEGVDAVLPWHETRAGIEARGVELGIGRWDEAASQLGRGEAWPSYRARVFAAAGMEPDA